MKELLCPNCKKNNPTPLGADERGNYRWYCVRCHTYFNTTGNGDVISIDRQSKIEDVTKIDPNHLPWYVGLFIGLLIAVIVSGVFWLFISGG